MFSDCFSAAALMFEVSAAESDRPWLYGSVYSIQVFSASLLHSNIKVNLKTAALVLYFSAKLL